MSSDNGDQSQARQLAQKLLGVPPHGPDQEVSLDVERLKEAMRIAYDQGVQEATESAPPEHTELYFWHLMDSLPDHVYFKDTRSRFTCVNRAQAKFLGVVEPNDAIGKSDFDFLPEAQARERFEAEQEIMNSGTGYSMREETDLHGSDNARICMVSTKLPLRDAEGHVYGTFGISRDVTSRYLAERELERQKNLMEAIIQILPCRIFVRNLENRFILVNQAYQEALGVENREEIIGHRLSEFSREERIEKIREEDARVRENGESILNQVEFDKSVFKKDSWVVVSKVPLRGEDMAIEGIVGMTYDITEQKQAEQEAKELSEELREKNAQFEAELLVARQLQETLMAIGFDAERRFRQEGTAWSVEAGYYYKPSHHLAGDFFDLIPISENKLGFLVCDVMGHGVKAALVTMLLRGLIWEFSDILDQPARMLGQLNKRLCSLADDQEFPRFTTAVYLTLDLETGEARIANAGHPTPLWKTRDANGHEKFEPCPCNEIGPALGLIPDQVYTRKEFTCDETTEFLLYTDGIIEQTDALGQEFGIRKLEEILLNNESENITSQLKTLKSALRLTAGTKEFDDDICLLAVKVQPRSVEALASQT